MILKKYTYQLIKLKKKTDKIKNKKKYINFLMLSFIKN